MRLQALLRAGASLRGTTQMDEMAFSLDGENAHYGAPENPAAPGRAAGGSSIGSAVGLCRQLAAGLEAQTRGSTQRCQVAAGLASTSLRRVAAQG